MSVEGAEEEKSDKVDDKTEEKQPESDKIIEQNEKMDAEPKPNQNNVIKNGKEPKKGENANGEKCSNVTEEENDGHESPIRLTLEDDDETLHDVEVGIFILKTKSTYHAYFFFQNETTAEKSTTEKDAEDKSEGKFNVFPTFYAKILYMIFFL